MFAWQRKLKSIIRYVGLSVGTDLHSVASVSSCSDSSLVIGKSGNRHNVWKVPSANISRPLYHHLQQLGMSSSRGSLVNYSGKAPVPLLKSGSPANSGGAKTNTKKEVIPNFVVKSSLKRIRQNPVKVNYIGRFVRYMTVDDAFIQLELCQKRAAKIFHSALRKARGSAVHNYGLDPKRLMIQRMHVGKGKYKTSIRYHGKGHHGIEKHKSCHLFLELRELTAEEELKMVRLKVARHVDFKKLSTHDQRLVPHHIIEVDPVWGVRPKSRRSRRPHHQNDVT